jgi:hypothetical protein
MIHPFAEDLSALKENELEEKVQELTRKYYQASRLGKPELLTQIATFVTIYKDELSKRYRERTQAELDGDLDQLINVNK